MVTNTNIDNAADTDLELQEPRIEDKNRAGDGEGGEANKAGKPGGGEGGEADGAEKPATIAHEHPIFK